MQDEKIEVTEAVKAIGFETRTAIRNFDVDGSRMRDTDAFTANCVSGDKTKQGDFRGFRTDAVYSVSNAIGFELELSPDLEAVRGRRKLYDGTLEISDWIEIDVEVRESEEYSETHSNFEHVPIVRGLFGFDIPLHEAEVIPNIKCSECGVLAKPVGGGSFNDCPNEGGEEYGNEIVYLDLSCGHRNYE